MTASSPFAGRPHARAAHRGRPAVAGVAGGVGTSTIAAAIGGADCGVFVSQPVDVLVCRATSESLIRAARASQVALARSGRSPVLAVTRPGSSKLGRPVAARLRLVQSNVASLVVLPFVRRWREAAAPLDEARSLLAVPRNELPRDLRNYALLARDLCTALERRSPASARPPIGRAAPSAIPGRTL